jgi:hypothetical protein
MINRDSCQSSSRVIQSCSALITDLLAHIHMILDPVLGHCYDVGSHFGRVKIKHVSFIKTNRGWYRTCKYLSDW